MTDVLLELREINKHFPGVHALKDARFDVRRGEVHALIGENGAGKSTMIKIISGVYQPDTGETLLDGRGYRIQQPARGACCRHRHHLSGTRLIRGVVGGREYLHGSRADKKAARLGDRRLGADGGGGGSPACRTQHL